MCVEGSEEERPGPPSPSPPLCVPVTERKAIYNTAHTEGEGERGPFLTSSIYLSSDLPKREGARKKKDERTCVTHS